MHCRNGIMHIGVTLLGLLASATIEAQVDFSNYHTPAQVDAILVSFQTANPGLARVVTLGNSLEGRPIRALKISDNVATDEAAEADVVYLALHHAREWISVEMALYIADQILLRYPTDARLAADVNASEIWIVPVVNPDGFEYTRTTNRYWRKNRRNNGDGTFGVDLNRNWGYEWGRADGSSPNTFDDTYRGSAPFSEPEIQVIRNFLAGLNNLKTLLTYHSFSELFLRPWGYTTLPAPGEQSLQALVQRSIAAIQAVHGHTYSETIGYTASGETTDYLWGESRTSAFTPELRPATGGLNGFSPPPSEILPSNQENLPAALALLHDAAAREVWIRDYPADSGAEPSAVWTGSNWSHAFWLSPDITTVPETLDQGATVSLGVHVNNNTGTTVNGVRVDVYYNDPRITLEFPNPSSVLIGSRTVNVPAGGTTITMPWTVPIGTNSWGERHWCVGAVIMHANDLPLTTHAQRTSNIGIRNFNTTTTVVTTTLIVAATNFLDVAAELAVSIDTDALKPGWRATLPIWPEAVATSVTRPSQRKAKLLGVKNPVLEPGETIYIPVHVAAPSVGEGEETSDVHVHSALIPLIAGKREALGNGFTYRVKRVPAKAEPCNCR